MIDPDRFARRGRGAVSTRAGRFEPRQLESVDDGWGTLAEALADPLARRGPRTTITPEHPKTIIRSNDSPDVGFDRSINPYQGCEHGCIYCYARPTHTYLGLGAGLDFETKLFSKPDAASLLRRELSKPGYEPKTIVLGTNTDCYQPAERALRITRGLLEVLEETGHPIGVITKSRGVVRDGDVLARMAKRGLARVAVSVTTLDPALSRTLEPRAAPPSGRLDAIRALSEAGVPVMAMVAPIIPGVTDAEIEGILQAVAEAGARSAGRILLRLPQEVGGLFEEWLAEHRPLRARHVLDLVRQCRDGALSSSAFGTRMRGTGPYADLIHRRFEVAARRHGLDGPLPALDATQFRAPVLSGGQLRLFG